MHKTFGDKENVTYLDREGAYTIPIKDNKIGVIKTPIEQAKDFLE